MDKEIRLILMSKIIKALKFYNDESHSEYNEVIFSPFFKELQEENRVALFEHWGYDLNDPSFHPPLKDGSEEYNRFLKVLSNKDLSKLDEGSKLIMIDILTYPYNLTSSQQQVFLETMK